MVSDDTVVVLDCGAAVERFTLTLGEFIEANSMEEDEAAEIRSTLAQGQTYVGGGGAIPIFKIEIAD